MLSYAIIALAMAASPSTSVAAAQSPSQSQRETPPRPKGFPVGFDIAGLNLGMSPENVQHILSERGFSVEATVKGNFTFAELVKERAEKMQGRYNPLGKSSTQVSIIRAASKDGSRLRILFDTAKQGPQVTSIDFEVPSSGRGPEFFAKSLEQKYGIPSQGPIKPADIMDLAWCGLPSCYPLNTSPPRLRAKFYAGSKLFLSLTEGAIFHEKIKQQIEQEAAVMASASAKPLNF
jgi:hypothetical protein